MRIVMLTQFYPPIIGGEEQHVRNLSAALVQRGHEVAVITLQHHASPTFKIDQGVRVYRIRGTLQRMGALFDAHGRQHAPPFPDPEAMLHIEHIVRQERPHIVHAHNWFGHDYVPLKRFNGAKFVMTLHDYGRVCATHNLTCRADICSGPALAKCLGCAGTHYGKVKGSVTTFGNWLMSIPQQRAVDMFIPVSHAVANGVQLPASGRPFQVIPNFVPDDVATLRPGYDDLLAKLPTNGYLLFVGDLRKLKGIEVLLQAYAQLQQQLPDMVPLVLIGRQVDAPTALPPNTLVFNSWPHEAVMHAWKRSLFGIAPSLWPEPCATVVMEGMACGKPMIGTRVGGTADMISDGETGFLVPPKDVGALRDRMAQLVGEPALRRRMGVASLKHVVDFQAQTVIPRIEQLYLRLTASHSAAVLELA